MNILTDLLTRIFLNVRTSLNAVATSIIAWLFAQGIDLSEANRTKVLAVAALVAHVIWNLFSKDPEPVEPEPAPAV